MKELSVAAIKHGTVIDHITAGQALRIVHLLQLNGHQNCVTLGLNLPSGSMRYKDIIKVGNREVDDEDLGKIAVFAPKATINIIQDYKIVNKFKIKMPEQIEQVLLCANEKCITNHEPMSTCFRVRKFGNKVELQCHYCQKNFAENARMRV